MPPPIIEVTSPRQLKNPNKTHREITLSLKKIDYLDGWRGLAIVMLLIGHFFPYWRLSMDYLGVNLFFVLSGLLMGKLLFAKETPIPLFYKRRISRVMPALYVFIFSIVLAYSTLNLPISKPEAIGAMALIRNYLPPKFGNEVPFDHIWSLSVEEHSYIVLSLIALLARSGFASAKLLLGLGISTTFAAAAWYDFFEPGGLMQNFRLIRTEVSSFGILFSAFLVVHLQNRKRKGVPQLMFPALTLVALLAHQSAAPLMVTIFVGVGALALLVNLLSEAPSWVLRILRTPALRKMGMYSFSIYLWQQPFYVLKHNGFMPAWIACLCGVALGLGSYHCIENPIRNYLNAKWAKEPGPMMSAGQGTP